MLARLRELRAAGSTSVLLAGDGPDGVCVLRFQPSLWSRADEGYIAELYVIPDRRRHGLGSALLEAALDLCRRRGCDYVFLGTDEGDTDAHRLYERHGFSNLVEPGASAGERERMLVYECDL